MQRLENFGPILSRFWTKVHEIFRRCKRPLVLFDAIARLSILRFIKKIFAIKSRSRQKPIKSKSFLAPTLLGRKTPNFVRQIMSAIYCPPSAKVWLSFVCWSPSAKPGNEIECRIYVRWVKWRSVFKPFVYQSSWHFVLHCFRDIYTYLPKN